MPIENGWYSGQGQRHRLFADEADRLGDATSYLPSDRGAQGVQLDTGQVFGLASISPISWVPSKLGQALAGPLTSAGAPHTLGRNTFTQYDPFSAGGFEMITPLNPVQDDEFWICNVGGQGGVMTLTGGSGKAVTPPYALEGIGAAQTFNTPGLIAGWRFLAAFDAWKVITTNASSIPMFPGAQTFAASGSPHLLFPHITQPYDGTATHQMNFPANPVNGDRVAIIEIVGGGGVVTLDKNGGDQFENDAGVPVDTLVLTKGGIYREWLRFGSVWRLISPAMGPEFPTAHTILTRNASGVLVEAVAPENSMLRKLGSAAMGFATYANHSVMVRSASTGPVNQIISEGQVLGRGVGGNLGPLNNFAMRIQHHHDEVISPAQITSNQLAYNPTGFGTAEILRLNSDAARDINGFLASVVDFFGGVHRKRVWNVGGFNITLKHQEGTEAAANRILSTTGADIVITPDGYADIWYDTDGGVDRWRASPTP